MWTDDKIELLKTLWTAGQSAGQIAPQIGVSRSAVCAKWMRLGLKRGRPQPTAKPRILSGSRRRATAPNGAPERRPRPNSEYIQNLTTVSRGASPVDRRSPEPPRPLRKDLSTSKPKGRPVPFTKTELRAMLAEAVRNTG